MNGMKTFATMFVVAIVAMAALATDMDHKGRVVATVKTASAGVAEVTCNEPGGWEFDVSASQDDGRDVVTVKISSPTNALPPQFSVFFRVPGAGVQNVWTSDCSRDTTFKGEGFTHKARIADGGWEAELFIPWTVFEAKPPKAGESWNANVVVNRHSEPEETAGTSFTLNNNSNLGMFGLLSFVGKCD